jgi:hypothetical protein
MVKNRATNGGRSSDKQSGAHEVCDSGELGWADTRDERDKS